MERNLFLRNNIEHRIFDITHSHTSVWCGGVNVQMVQYEITNYLGFLLIRCLENNDARVIYTFLILKKKKRKTFERIYFSFYDVEANFIPLKNILISIFFFCIIRLVIKRIPIIFWCQTGRSFY